MNDGHWKEARNEFFETATFSNFQTASILDRTSAFFLDNFFILTIFKILSVWLFSFFFKSLIAELWYGSIIYTFILSPLYFISTTLIFGGSPGKIIVGLKVVDGQQNLKLSLIRIILREFIGKNISVLLLYFGVLMALFNKRKKTFHDLIANTHVIKFR